VTAKPPRDLLNYVIEGEGPPVILLHPVGLDHTCWDAVAPRLSAGHRLIRIDLRGHGLSSLPDEDYTLADYADDVHAVLVATGLRPAAIVGLSFGGMVAQTVVIRHPDVASAAVFAGTSAAQTPERREIAIQRAEAALRDGMGALVAPTLQRWFTPGFIAGGGAEATRARLIADDPRGWASAWRAMSDLDAGPALPGIGIPTLCLAGEADLAVPTTALEAMAAAIPGGRYVMLPGASHMMQIENAGAFSDAVLAFLREALSR
jgi:3-oxoadipate enol-lactonase